MRSFGSFSIQRRRQRGKFGRIYLYVALDAGYIDGPTFTTLTTLTLEVTRLIAGFIRYLDKSDMSGAKYS